MGTVCSNIPRKASGWFPPAKEFSVAAEYRKAGIAFSSDFEKMVQDSN
jgi:hypothetical protein